MRTSANVTATALFLALAAATALHASECRFDRNLTVSGNPNMVVNTGSGDVRIHGSTDGQIHIHGHVKSNTSWFGGSQANAQDVCNQPPVEQNGNDVRIGKQHAEIYHHVSIDYDIETPRATDLNASTGSGNLELNELTGRVIGNTGSGDIHANGLPADTKLETGSGNITARNLAGGSKLNTGSGDIHLQQSAPGDVRANTGSGNIEITGLAGGLSAETGSGWIHADGIPAANWRAETGSGDVRIRVAGDKGFEVDAESSSGDINVNQNITMQGNISKHHVHGTVNGGGPILRISTGSGNIEIR